MLDYDFTGSFSVDPDVWYTEYPTLALPAEDEAVFDDEVLVVRRRVQDDLEERVLRIFAAQRLRKRLWASKGQ